MGDPIVGAGLSNRAKSIMPGETGTETGTVAGGHPSECGLAANARAGQIATSFELASSMGLLAAGWIKRPVMARVRCRTTLCGRLPSWCRLVGVRPELCLDGVTSGSHRKLDVI